MSCGGQAAMRSAYVSWLREKAEVASFEIPEAQSEGPGFDVWVATGPTGVNVVPVEKRSLSVGLSAKC